MTSEYLEGDSWRRDSPEDATRAAWLRQAACQASSGSELMVRSDWRSHMSESSSEDFAGEPNFLWRHQYSSFNKTTRRVGRMLFLMPQRLYVLAPPSPQICRPAKYQIRASLETRPVANTERRLGTPSPEREAFQKYHATVVNPAYCASN